MNELSIRGSFLAAIFTASLAVFGGAAAAQDDGNTVMFGTNPNHVDGYFLDTEVLGESPNITIRLSLTNKDTENTAILSFDDTNIKAVSIDNKSSIAVYFRTLIANNVKVSIPPGETRIFHLYAPAMDGAYLFEFNPCVQFGKSCPIQRYVSVGTGVTDPSFQNSSTTEKPTFGTFGLGVN